MSIPSFNEFNRQKQDNDSSDIFNEISKPFNNFFERINERINAFKEVINDRVSHFKQYVEEIMEDFSNEIVGEPMLVVDSDLREIEVKFHTNIPNSDESFELMDELERNVSRVLDKKYKNAWVDIENEPDENGNCVIRLQMDIVYDDILGDYTDALKQLGEEY